VSSGSLSNAKLDLVEVEEAEVIVEIAEIVETVETVEIAVVAEEDVAVVAEEAEEALAKSVVRRRRASARSRSTPSRRGAAIVALAMQNRLLVVAPVAVMETEEAVRGADAEELMATAAISAARSGSKTRTASRARRRR